MSNLNCPADETPLLEGGSGIHPEMYAGAPADAAFRTALLARTSGIVRRGARRRRALVAGGAMGAYVLGLVSAWILVQRPGAVAEGPRPGPGDPGAMMASTAAVVPMVHPAQLRREVLAAPPQERVALLLRAGDLYLDRYGDVEGALHCYRQVLELEPTMVRHGKANERTWLFAALVYSQQEEKRHDARTVYRQREPTPL